MSELKVYHCNEWRNEYTEFYLKYDADKVIEDLEESHKREVEQLLMDVVKLKDNLNETREWLIESQRLHKRCADGAIKKIRHQKFKRCLAMAWWCSAELGMLVSTWEFKIKHYKKWHKRWLELAEKFKEAK